MTGQIRTYPVAGILFLLAFVLHAETDAEHPFHAGFSLAFASADPTVTITFTSVMAPIPH